MPIPFTVIGGFLGAGKTTLVNAIIGQTHGTRFALLINDFGEINIDANLIAKHDGKTLELSNGCICCSLANGFVQTMLEVMERCDEIDHIVVEASGVSDPQKIMNFARLDPQLLPDVVIILIDAANCREHLADPLIADTVKTQIYGANVLLLNKTDLNPDPEELIDDLNRLNADALIIRCQRANFPVEALTGIYTRSIGVPADDENSDRVTGETIEHPFRTLTWTSAKKIDKRIFADTIAEAPRSIIRGKGFLLGRKAYYIWHLCGKEQVFSPQSSSERNMTEITFIGLDGDDLDVLRERLGEMF